LNRYLRFFLASRCTQCFGINSTSLAERPTSSCQRSLPRPGHPFPKIQTYARLGRSPWRRTPSYNRSLSRGPLQRTFGTQKNTAEPPAAPMRNGYFQFAGLLAIYQLTAGSRVLQAHCLTQPAASMATSSGYQTSRPCASATCRFSLCSRTLTGRQGPTRP